MNKTIAIVSAAAFLASATPAFAFLNGPWVPPTPSPESNVTISNTNDATVTNNVTTSSNTGNNDSFGGNARSYTRAYKGDATSNATGGNGGSVNTGSAWAYSDVLNNVNNNDVVVDKDCGCAGDVTVRNLNDRASVNNTVSTSAKTGDNLSEGGKAKSKASARGYWWFGGDASSTTRGGNGGSVDTGNADSKSIITNYVNSNVVRVR